MLRSEINVRTAVVVGGKTLTPIENNNNATIIVSDQPYRFSRSLWGEYGNLQPHGCRLRSSVRKEQQPRLCHCQYIGYTAPIVKVDPFDNCMDITSNVTGKIGIIMRSTFDNCSLANQVFNVFATLGNDVQINNKGAIGVVVMNNMCLSSYDYLQKMSDSDSVNYNVGVVLIHLTGQYTIPVISVTCSTGMSVINLIAANVSTIATISSLGEGLPSLFHRMQSLRLAKFSTFCQSSSYFVSIPGLLARSSSLSGAGWELSTH